MVKVKAKGDDMTVSEFLYEFVEKYGAKRWVASTYDGNVGLLENYVHPYLGDKKLKSIRTKTVDDYTMTFFWKRQSLLQIWNGRNVNM